MVQIRLNEMEKRTKNSHGFQIIDGEERAVFSIPLWTEKRSRVLNHSFMNIYRTIHS